MIRRKLRVFLPPASAGFARPNWLPNRRPNLLPQTKGPSIPWSIRLNGLAKELLGLDKWQLDIALQAGEIVEVGDGNEDA